MKQHFRKDFIITSLVCLLPVLMGLALYSRLPGQIAVHWNWEGAADGYRSRVFAVFGLPALLLGVNAFVHFMLAFDPKHANISLFTGRVVRWLVPALSLFVNGFTLLSAVGIAISVRVAVPVAVGLIFVICGIILPFSKQNYTIGIKLPWTLNSEENWNRTHRMAGPVFIVGGILYALSSLSPYRWAGIVVILVVTLAPGVYSFLLFRKGI